MRSICYSEDCGYRSIPPERQSESTQELCQSLRKVIVDAGGASLLEVTQCPFVAVYHLKPEPTESISAGQVKGAFREKLGIVAYAGMESV